MYKPKKLINRNLLSNFDINTEELNYLLELSEKFKELTKILNLSNNDFIRTTEKRHHKSVEDLWNKLAKSGDRKQVDLLIGDVVNEIGSLHPEVTASNFAKARDQENLSQDDIAASISNMIGEVIGTISYLNALLCGESEVFFLGRVTLNDVIRSGVEDRLKLANVNGLFKQNREYGNVLGALSYIQTK